MVLLEEGKKLKNVLKKLYGPFGKKEKAKKSPRKALQSFWEKKLKG